MNMKKKNWNLQEKERKRQFLELKTKQINSIYFVKAHLAYISFDHLYT